MAIPAGSIPRQGLRTADGEVFAYLVQADELARMHAELEDLRTENTRLQAERDRNAARVAGMVQDWVPRPMTAEQSAGAEQNPGDLSVIIVELEKK